MRSPRGRRKGDTKTEPKTTQAMICENIRRIAEEKKIKHIAIGNALGLSRQGFSDLINGRRILRAAHMPVIAKALGVGIATLFAERK